MAQPLENAELCVAGPALPRDTAPGAEERGAGFPFEELSDQAERNQGDICGLRVALLIELDASGLFLSGLERPLTSFPEQATSRNQGRGVLRPMESGK